jgi:STE24 endopeptidase
MSWLTSAFLTAVAAGTLLRLWLSARQIDAVAARSSRVPEPFRDHVSDADHRKAADYTVASIRFGRLSLLADVAVMLALTVGGGIAALDGLWARSGWTQPWEGTAVVITVLCLSALVDLPFSLWRTFKLEARFGFNRSTARVFGMDLAKGALLALLIGVPVVLVALSLMDRAGPLWWLWAWGGWLGLMLAMTWAWPAFIAPLFNKFSALQDGPLEARVNSLLERCGFASKGVYVVDGSRRSAHGNAYFTGIGRHKRIVFFDTLLSRLAHAEVEAVLAHELGHFKLKHIRATLLITLATSFMALAVLGWLATQPLFYQSLGVTTASAHAALLLFMLAAPVLTFFATPLGAWRSRRHEFEADAFAARHASADDLATALVKLHRDNATTLTTDPLYSAFYYSHPPALERIAQLRQPMAGSERSPVPE